MTVAGIVSSVIHRDCDICRCESASVVQTVIDPLIVSVTTYVCPTCYPVSARAYASLQRLQPRLVIKEHAA